MPSRPNRDLRTGLSDVCVQGGVAGGMLGLGEPLCLAPGFISLLFGRGVGVVVQDRRWVCELEESQYMRHRSIITQIDIPVVILRVV